MKKILVSMMTIAMVSALIGGGIYAAFSDTETSGTNQFTSGSLDLTVNGSNGTAFTAVTASAMEPGDSGNQTYTLVNAASTTVGGDWSVNITGVTNDGGTNWEPEGDTTGDLGANLTIELFQDNGAGGGTANNGIKDGTEESLYSGTVDGATTGPWSPTSGTLTANGGTDYLGLSYSIASGVGNSIMGDSVEFLLVISLS